MKRLGSQLLVAALVASALVGCGNKGDSPTGTIDDNGPAVELVSAGAGELKTIRLDVEPGTKQRGTMTMKMGVEMSLDGQTFPSSDVPPMEMDMSFSVDDVRPDGVIEASFRYGDTRVVGSPGAMVDALDEQLSTLEGITGTFQTTDRGAVLEADIDVPKDVPTLIRQTMESFQSQMQNLSVPFPVEPVGVGASWTYPTEAEINGIRMNAVYTYTLKSRTADRVVLAYTMKQTAPEQDPKIPGVPDGVEVHLDRMEMSGSGTGVVALGSPMPVKMRNTASGTSRMTMTADGQSQQMRQDMTFDVRYAR